MQKQFSNPSSDQDEEDLKRGIAVKIDDLSKRYAFHGSSLHLVEEICSDARMLGQLDTMKDCFLRALDYAPVSVHFFETFLSEEDFLMSFGTEGQRARQLFTIYYEAACITMNPKLWCSLIELALLPQIDFNDDELKVFPLSNTTRSGPPLLFPGPDLYLGCADFASSLVFMHVYNENYPKLAAGEIDECGDLLGEELGVCPLTNLISSALTVCSNHPTLSSALWAIIRNHVNKTLTELLDKWQTSSAPLSENEGNFSSLADPPLQPEKTSVDGNYQERDLMWSIFSESWRLRLLFYRQLNTPLFNLLDILDEYRLFEHQLPDIFRILEINLNLVVSDIPRFKEEILARMDQRLKGSTQEAELSRLNACLQSAEKYFERSEKIWSKDRDFERLASHFGESRNKDLTEENAEEDNDGKDNADLIMATSDSEFRRHKLSLIGQGDLFLSTEGMDPRKCPGDEGMELPTSSDEEGTMSREGRFFGTWEAGVWKEKVCQLWTEHINKQEAEIVRLQNPFATPTHRRSVASVKGPEGKTVICKQNQDNHSVNLLQYVDSLFNDTRHQLALQKRKVACCYIRAIEDLGDVRLDLFGAFWEFLQRAASESNVLPTSKWQHYWLTWLADTACRNQPLRSCCWVRQFDQAKKLAWRELDDISSFVNELTKDRRGAFRKFLDGPNWWKIDEVLPPPGFLDAEVYYFAVTTDEVIQTHSSEFLTAVFEAVKACEDVFRVYLSQEKIFTASSDDQCDSATKSESEMSNDLFRAVCTLLDMAETRVLEYTAYLTSSKLPLSALNELQPLMAAFFAAIMSMKVIRGIFIARLRKPIDLLKDHCERVSDVAELFSSLILPPENVSTSYHIETIESLVINLKVGLLLSMVACIGGNRYFHNLKGTWLGSSIIRGDCCPRVISRMFFEQPFDASFEPICQRLLKDTELRELKKRHDLSRAVQASAEYAQFLLSKAHSIRGKTAHVGNDLCRGDMLDITPTELSPLEAMMVPLKWLGELNNAMRAGLSWEQPPGEIPPVSFLATTQIIPPVAFPIMGAPVSVALEELKERPFSAQLSAAREHPQQTSLDYSSRSSSSSSSDVSLSHAVAKVLRDPEHAGKKERGTTGSSVDSIITTTPMLGHAISTRVASPLLNRQTISYSPRDSPTSSPPRSVHRECRQLGSPNRRLSFEEIGKLTQATRDGHEAIMPSLAPSIPPALPHSDDLLPSDEVGSGTLRSLSSSSMSAAIINECSMGDETQTEEASCSTLERKSARAGHHFLQIKHIGDATVDEALFGQQVEWNTLWISNLEMSATSQSLQHEIESLGGRGVKDVRVVTDRKNRSKGFAYVEFGSHDEAQTALRLIDGRKIQGLKIKAALSMPKCAIYEERTVFVASLPENTSELELRNVFGSIENHVLAERRRSGGGQKRVMTRDQDVKTHKKVRVEDESQDIDIVKSDDDDDMEETGESFKEDMNSWTIREIRLRTKAPKASKASCALDEKESTNGECYPIEPVSFYGYVEFDHRSAVIDVLKTYSDDPKLFVVGTSPFVVAPSIPKKEHRVIKAPKARSKELSREGKKESSALERTLHVSNLPFNYLEEKVEALFRDYGALERIVVPRDPNRPAKSRGFAFVEFKDKLDASMALTSLDGSAQGERILMVSQSSRPITVRKTEASRDEPEPMADANLDAKALDAMARRKVKKAQYAGRAKIHIGAQDGDSESSSMRPEENADLLSSELGAKSAPNSRAETNAEFRDRFLGGIN